MRGNILIVEDYADWRELLSGMLRREGYQVESRTNLKDAHSFLDETKNVDLAILDIRLVETDEHNEDGMRLLSDIRQTHPYTRVIIISGHGTMEIQRRAFRDFQAYDFFRKEQFDSEDFRQRVQQGVEMAARERQSAKDQKYVSNQRYQRWQAENR